MTPNALLKEVVNRFDILLADEDDLLESLLRQSLRTYQDKAGYVRTVKYTEGIGGLLAYPADYLQLVSIEDGDGEVVLFDLMEDGIHINLLPPSRYVKRVRYPITVSYLIDFTSADLDAFQVPLTTQGLIMNHLECLIKAKNVPRLHRQGTSSKVDVSYLPDEATLYARQVELETDMASQKAIIRGASIYGG